jgi:hypothetical protein
LTGYFDLVIIAVFASCASIFGAAANIPVVNVGRWAFAALQSLLQKRIAP